MLLLAALIGLSAPPPAWAWEGHHRLTRLALAGIPELDVEVRAESLLDFLAASRISEKEFLRLLELNPGTAFPFKAGETPSAGIPLRTVLETYSDEPDWGMDQDLFRQYPHLWKEAYAYMGGNLGGKPSQAFRHMHWPKGFFRLGPDGGMVFDPTPIGEAPDRGRLFQQLGREAFGSGHPYWGGRFLAWAAHYAQDAAQPFHAAQLPDLRMAHRGPGGRVDVPLTARIVAYYHFALEFYAGRALEGRAAAGRAPELRAALGGRARYEDEDAAGLLRKVSELAQARAEEAGRLSLEFFPPAGDPSSLDPESRLGSPEFWEAVRGREAGGSPAFGGTVELLKEVLGCAGAATRTLASGIEGGSETVDRGRKPALPSLSGFYPKGPAPSLFR